MMGRRVMGRYAEGLTEGDDDEDDDRKGQKGLTTLSSYARNCRQEGGTSLLLIALNAAWVGNGRKGWLLDLGMV